MASNSDKPLFVGRDNEAKILMHWLNDFRGIRVISVTGEKGIGKTALVRSVYDRPETEHRFSCRAWISGSNGMSQQHMVVELIKQLIEQCPLKEMEDLDRMEKDELGQLLYSLLKEFRYLIVLDDLMDSELDEKWMNDHFPDNGKGSRVIVTSTEVLHSLPGGEWGCHLPLEQLDGDCCRKLLLGNHRIVDEDVTEKILRKCGGSPLKLVLWGGLVMAAEPG